MGKTKFSNLYRKIYLSIVVPSFTLVAVIAFLSTFMLRSSMNDTFIGMAEQKFQRSVNSCELYISSVEASAYNIASSAEVFDALTSLENTTLTELLDSGCHFDGKIAAITVYSADGTKEFSSSTVTNAPSLSDLLENSDIAEFVEGGEDSFISVRNTVIADIYNGSVYPAQSGIVSCCRKIYNGENIIGYLFADILPHDLYEYFDYSDTTYFQKTIAFIAEGNMFTEYRSNASSQDVFEKIVTRNVSSDLKYAYFYSADSCPITLYAAVPMTGYHNFLILIGAVFFVVGFALMLSTHFVGKKQAAKVSERLDKLLDKMNREGYELE